MAKQKTILFLCTGNYYRSRFAEVYFNSVAAKMGMPWKATSSGLALERGLHNIGPMAPASIEALRALRVNDAAAFARMPRPATTEDFETASFVVGLKKDEHLPLMRERFPAWADKVEYWNVEDEPGVLGLIEREVDGLAARLIGGGERREPVAAAKTKSPPAAIVKVGRETKGRRGKGVTLVWDVPLDEAGLLQLAATLKQKCGTGGAVKDGRIEIQGDQRDRLAVVLEELGYRVKRAGG